ncbi:MAG: hypothetical protein D6753_06335 [Planctomycetota bacterium]|nr:MAG: hypothetical protein D6753_06335 [Planctomycetota bacterium]
MSRILHFVGMAAGGLAALGLAGCGGGNTESTAGGSAEAAQSAQVVAQGVSTPETPESGAESTTIIDEGESSQPAQCVAVFMDSLRRGDERAVNAMLTAKAREELAKTSYVIEPLGAPEGQFQIGRVAFPYEEKNVALVECVWTDPPVADQPAVSMDIVCEVHLEPEGWRMSALGLNIPGTDEALVLDFEDAAALQATIDAALGVPPTAEPTQTAAGATASPAGTQASSQVGGDQLPTSTGLPPLPSGNLRSIGPQAPQPTGTDKIALPPIDSAPLQR